MLLWDKVGGLQPTRSPAPRGVLCKSRRLPGWPASRRMQRPLAAPPNRTRVSSQKRWEEARRGGSQGPACGANACHWALPTVYRDLVYTPYKAPTSSVPPDDSWCISLLNFLNRGKKIYTCKCKFCHCDRLCVCSSAPSSTSATLCSHRHCFRNLPIAPNERRAQEVAAGLSLPCPARQPRGPLPLSLAPRICLFQVRPARGLARCLIVRVWRLCDVGVRPCRGVCRRFAPRQGGTASPCPPRSWRVPVARWRALRLFPPFLTLAFFF